MPATSTLPKHPILFQLNARVALQNLSNSKNQRATFADIPDRFISWLSDSGFDTLYLLGVWTPGKEGLAAAQHVMKDSGLPQDHISSSPFAVVKYEVNEEYGGVEGLKALRSRLVARGLRLFLDFVPNHVAIDHEWVADSPPTRTRDLVMTGSEELFREQPQNFKSIKGVIVAHGKDPHFDGWTDTAQLNYFSDTLRKEMCSILQTISGLADGVRCDMAMLVCSDVLMKTWGSIFERTHGRRPAKPEEFWSSAIKSVKSTHPDFQFIAEVYWEMEPFLMELGFDYCYDKGLYDKLCHASGRDLKKCFSSAPYEFQRKCVRFLENHDEPRAAETFQDLAKHRAAAALTLLSPGMRFIHQGQLEARRLYVPMQQNRTKDESLNGDVATIYRRLLPIAARKTVKDGEYSPWEVHASSHGSDRHEDLLTSCYTLTPPVSAEGGSSVVSNDPPVLIV
eukprot:GHVU01102163.1.p1 GENE.GHVU01102163.1~~GHVU01102163.1.p1  ORF type:complete len:452 (-),score=84.96 GHVU01102163.1:816-2171(-)